MRRGATKFANAQNEPICSHNPSQRGGSYGGRSKRSGEGKELWGLMGPSPRLCSSDSHFMKGSPKCLRITSTHRARHMCQNVPSSNIANVQNEPNSRSACAGLSSPTTCARRCGAAGCCDVRKCQVTTLGGMSGENQTEERAGSTWRTSAPASSRLTRIARPRPTCRRRGCGRRRPGTWTPGAAGRRRSASGRSRLRGTRPGSGTPRRAARRSAP